MNSLLAVLLMLLATAVQLVAEGAPRAPTASTAQVLDSVLKKYNFPALAVVVVKDGKICDRAAVGVRKAGAAELVTTNDQFHIGSCTKSMTATLAAMLIEEANSNGNTTMPTGFPNSATRWTKPIVR